MLKRLLQKAILHQSDLQQGNLKPSDLDAHIVSHFGIPSTASVLAVDPIQRLLAVGTLDGRIKVVGGNNIEGLLISPKQLPYKNLEFLQNEGYLVGISNDNEIQVWNLEKRCITYSRQWESNITAFSVISGSLFMLVGDEHGTVSVLKYAPEDGKLIDMPYHISPDRLVENDQTSPIDQPIVGVLPQPSTSGNRLLIAYQYGLLILWDVPGAKAIVIKGDTDLHIKDNVPDSPRNIDVDPCDDACEHMNEKEISALCWASSFGSMLAVGYIDGDILLWNIGGNTFSKGKPIGASGQDVVKLQLSSGKRLPVIVLHWGTFSQNSSEGQLFVYGGSEIGSDEVITVVSLQWSSPGMEILKNVRRVDLALTGSFADMVLLSSLQTSGKSHFDGLFALTNPGQLQFYSVETLSDIVSHQERKSSVSGIEPPVVTPTINPQMTTAKLTLLPYDATASVWLSEMTSVGPSLDPAEMRKWPLSGGTYRETSSAEEQQKCIYIAGYADGSVRIWNATNPTISLLSVLQGQVHGVENACSVASVTKLDLCKFTMCLAVANESGEVRVYNLKSQAECTKLHFLKHSEHKVYDVPSSKGPQCTAVVSVVNSPVRSLQFSSSGAKLAVGFDNGQVAVLDLMSMAVLFVSDLIPNISHPVVSVVLKIFSNIEGLIKGSKHSGADNAELTMEELMFTLTQDAKVNIIDSKTGAPLSSRPLHFKKKLKVISMYVIGESNLVSVSSSEQHEQPTKDSNVLQESVEDGPGKINDIKRAEHLSAESGSLLGSVVLVCGENKLRLYGMKSVIQGEDKPSYKVKLGNACCWTSLLSKNGQVCGIILSYNTGIIEVRSFPNLELVACSSLMSILRWNFRPKMEKLMTSSESGLISLVNGSELAFISLCFDENETRFLESLPLLHDKVVAAAADAAMRYSEKQKKQVPVVGVLGGIVKSFKKEKSSNANEYNFAQLEKIFSRPVTSGLSGNVETTEEEEEELDIDDIEIDDDPAPVASSSSYHAKGKQTETERERLFQGSSVDVKPRTRTPQEILAAYKGPEYAAAAAENARNKLLERQEKLERISKRTEDLRSEAEDFASMANELVKTMEARKWWKI